MKAGAAARLRQRPAIEPRQGDPARARTRRSSVIRATVQRRLSAAQAVTAADVKRVANKYLTRARRAEHRADRARRTWRRTPTSSTVVTDPFTEKTGEQAMTHSSRRVARGRSSAAAHRAPRRSTRPQSVDARSPRRFRHAGHDAGAATCRRGRRRRSPNGAELIVVGDSTICRWSRSRSTSSAAPISSSRRTRPGSAGSRRRDADRGHDASRPAIRSRRLAAARHATSASAIGGESRLDLLPRRRRDKFAPALAILADMLLQPDLSGRRRSSACARRTLVALTQAKDRDRRRSPASVFPKVLYTTRSSVRPLDRPRRRVQSDHARRRRRVLTRRTSSRVARSSPSSAT